MRKIKKINGYLVVKFNDRELREWEGTALGNYGVIDAELYTGCLDVDRSVMEYDGAETLEEAIEQARDLESELDVEEPAATYTIVTETDDDSKEEIVEPQLMIAGWETALEQQIESPRYPEVNSMTARHQLYGFKMALHQLDLLGFDDCIVMPDKFEDVAFACAEFVPEPDTFEHLPPEKQSSGASREVYLLGRLLENDCPENDCRLYLNTFRMCREIDKAIDQVEGYPREVLGGRLMKHYLELERMYFTNHAIREYRKGMQT